MRLSEYTEADLAAYADMHKFRTEMLRVVVTEEFIAKGAPKSAYSCALALALTTTTNFTWHVGKRTCCKVYDLMSVEAVRALPDREISLLYHMRLSLPQAARDFVDQYDVHYKSKEAAARWVSDNPIYRDCFPITPIPDPFEFTLTVPQWWMPQEPGPNRKYIFPFIDPNIEKVII